MVTQVRALETRRAIVAAASQVFVERGFAAASLAEIAERAGVTKGALYFHFASKSELARAIVTHQRDASVALVRDVEAFDVDRLQLLREMSRRLAERLVDDTALRAAMRFAVEQPDLGDGAVVGTYREWVTLVTRVVADGQARGEIRDELPADRIAQLLVGAFTGLQTVSTVSADLADLDDRIDDLWALLGEALAPR